MQMVVITITQDKPVQRSLQSEAKAVLTREGPPEEKRRGCRQTVPGKWQAGAPTLTLEGKSRWRVNTSYVEKPFNVETIPDSPRLMGTLAFSSARGEKIRIFPPASGILTLASVTISETACHTHFCEEGFILHDSC